MDSSEGLPSDLDGYWSVGPVSYKRSKTGALEPNQVDNPTSVWYTAGIANVSLDNEDNQYRVVIGHSHGSNQYLSLIHICLAFISEAATQAVIIESASTNVAKTTSTVMPWIFGAVVVAWNVAYAKRGRRQGELAAAAAQASGDAPPAMPN